MNLYATCCESAASSLAVTQYPPIAPNRNQVVKLLPQPGHLVGRTQIMPGGTQNQIQKAKQPQQILPKPIPPNSSPQKQTVPRLNTAMPQQTPLLINQPQAQSPALLLNQVLTSGAPVIVQPAGPGGTVHLMLRTPTPTLQSGPGPPQNKMIIANASQPQPQATVLIQNRQQVVRFMTAQGPVQFQQIQPPSGPQLIAIPQNQPLSFPANSVLVQGPATNTLQLQQNSGSPALQLRQSPSAILQSNSFAQTSLSNQISLQNQIFPASNASAVAAAVPTAATAAAVAAGTPGLKRDDKSSNAIEAAVCLPGSGDPKKIPIDTKMMNSKKIVNTVISNTSNSFNSGTGTHINHIATAATTASTNFVGNALGTSLANTNLLVKINKGGKGMPEDDALTKIVNKSLGTRDNLIGTAVSVSTPTSAQKTITTSLRQIRPSALANRNKQNQASAAESAKEKTTTAAAAAVGPAATTTTDDGKSMNNLSRIIDSVASNTEHLMSPPPKVVDNLTATINSVAENVKSPTPDDIMSKLSLTDVFITGNKSLNLNKRPNLTIVQKQVQGPKGTDLDEANRLLVASGTAVGTGGVDFEAITDNHFHGLDVKGVTTSAGVQTMESRGFVIDQSSTSSSLSSSLTTSQDTTFQAGRQDDAKKAKKKPCSKKKGKKEENRVDLWDLMKSAGIGDDEFDEPADVTTFPQNTTAIAEPLEIAASDTDLLAQIQSASQVPGGIRVVVGDDGRPVIINGDSVLIPESVPGAPAGTAPGTAESTDAESVLQNMILPDNVFNFTPQAFATAQTQLNQLIQDHGGLTTSSADQQLLSQIFGATASGIATSTGNVTTNSVAAAAAAAAAPAAVEAPAPPVVPTVQNQTSRTNNSDNLLVSVAPTSSEVSQPPQPVQKQESKSEYIGGPPPGLPPLGPDSLVITNNNGVPTLVASPALMQYLQTHQGIIQFQHDPVTKTIQPSLIIPHPQHKVEPSQAQSQDTRIDKVTAVVSNNVRPVRTQPVEVKRAELKASIGTGTDEVKGGLNAVTANVATSNVVKLNMVRVVKENPSLLQIATETNNLIGYKERNKNLTEKEVAEIDRKIQQNRAVLDQYLVVDNSGSPGVPAGVIVKETGGKDGIAYQKPVADRQSLDDLQHLDMALVKGFTPSGTAALTTTTTAAAAAASSGSDFQSKFLESIGMANKVPTTKATVGVGTGAGSVGTPVGVVVQSPSAASAKSRGRKKKEKNQSQGTQADVKADVPSLTFNIAELTPEQNVRLNQALQSRGPVVNQIENLDAIKQIIQEEVRKITSTSLENASIRFTSSANLSNLSVDGTGSEGSDTGPTTAAATATATTANVVLGNPNLNQLLDQSGTQGNVISLQGNELIAINSGNQQIFAPQNQVLSTGQHFVSSGNQILAIGGAHNQLVSLGNPINSSNQIVTLGNPPGLMSVGGNNVTAACPGAVIVGSNGNVLAIVHQNAQTGQNSPGIVQRIQTIQLTTPKQQHFKTLQSQIQTLSSKANRTAAEQATLQKLILEQQKILSTGKLLPTFPGQQVHGMQIVSQPIANASRLYQAQATTTTQQAHRQTTQTSQLAQVRPNAQVSQTPGHQHFLTGTSTGNLPSKSAYAGQTVVSCGTNTSDFNSSFQPNIPKLSVPPTVLISDVPTSNYGPLYVSPNTSGKNVTKCEKGTSPIQIQMGTQTVTNMEYRTGKMSTGTMTSPNTGKPQAVVAPAIVIQPTETPSPTYQMKPRAQTTVSEPLRPPQVPTLSRTAFIEQQMRTDQAGATMPDTKTPFLSKSDACKRLIRYHVMDEKALSPQDLATADDIFEATAQHLLDKFRAMKEKYKYLLMLESMREVSTAERIMVDRNFIIEERMELEELREKEKRLQEEFENPSIIYRGNADSTIIKTEFTLDDVKTEINNFMGPVKCEMTEDDNKETLISKSRHPSDIISDPTMRDTSFRLTESNRVDDLTRIKSETKECKNTRTPSRDPSPVGFGRPGSPGLGPGPGGPRARTKASRTPSDGSSRDEDSGADINAQVQSAIDSILNLQRCDTTDQGGDDADVQARAGKKKRRPEDRGPGPESSSSTTTTTTTKRPKLRDGLESMGEDDDDHGREEEMADGRVSGNGNGSSNGGGVAAGISSSGSNIGVGAVGAVGTGGGSSDADPILDEAIRSILTS